MTNSDKTVKDMQKRVSALQKKALLRKNTDLADRYLKGELVIWPEDERGIPNELVRCALFSAKNHNQKRKLYGTKAPLVIPIIGKGSIRFMGEELRQDDETVWMQLVHLAKESKSEAVEFTPHSFIKAIKWPNKGDSYTRLLDSIRRLGTARIEINSPRFKGGVGIGLIGEYVFHDGEGEPKTPWRVEVFSRASNLFIAFDKAYSRVDFETRLSLPEGVTTWLHGFYTSHREPFDHKIETIAIGAGIKLEAPEDDQLTEKEKMSKQKERLREAKKIIIKALNRLKKSGFLKDYEITKTNLIRVERKLEFNCG
jgi:hypothetical protein